MVRITNPQARKREVFAAVIENYITTAAAVSSEDLCEVFDCSSATIRNIMYELEGEGYLTHKYTSGGRIPTDKGYRYYVDMLLKQIELVESEKERLVKEYNTQLNKLEDLLEKTSEVLSSFTHYTGIVSFLDSGNKIYYNGTSFIAEYPEFNDIDKIRNVLRLLEERKRLLEIINRNLEKKLSIYIGRELACQEISSCSLVVSTYAWENKPVGRISVLGPRNMDYSRVISTLEYVSDLLSRALKNL